MHYDWEQLADRTYRCRLPFLDVTVGLVHGPRAVLLIDCGTTLSEASAIDADVRRLTGSGVSHLVLTHHHFDHILGCGGFPAAQCYGASAVASALSTGVDRVAAEAIGYGADPAAVRAAVLVARPPGHVVTQARIDLGDRVVAVEHPGRGHTDHDLVAVVAPATPGDRTVVFCGDLVEESADPAIGDDADLPAWPATLDRVLGLGGPRGVYVPGHGAAVDAAFVAAQRDWLAAR